MEPGEPLLTRRELAEKLRVHPDTIRRIKPPVAIRVGQQYRYYWSEVEPWLKARERSGGPERGAADETAG